MPAVVVIEGVEIPERLIADEAQHHPGVSSADARLAAGRALATKALLLDRATALGLEAAPEFDDEGREETHEDALIRTLLEREIDVRPPSEAECRRVYDARVSTLRGAGAAPPFAAVRDRIAEQLEQRAWTSAAARYVARLAAEARERGVPIRLTPDGAAERPPLSLGELIGEDGAALRLPAWLEAVDPPLAGRLAALAEAENASPGEIVRRAAADFFASADDAAWTSLVTAIREAGDPALAALARILKDRITPQPRTFTVVRRRR